MGITKKVMPRCFGTSQSVRARSMARSARAAPVFHTFWPFTTHSSPCNSAVVVRPARSEPAPGSLNSWHHFSSPVSADPRKRARSASGPCARMVGAARPVAVPTAGPTAPKSVISPATSASAQAGRPRPYHCSGHEGTAQPESSRRRRHSTRDSSGSQLAASHARSSWRTASGVAGSLTWGLDYQRRRGLDQDAMDTELAVVPGQVATIEIRRPPNNFFDTPLIQGIAEALEQLAADGTCRAVVLCSAGKHFCAGADFQGGQRQAAARTGGVHLYDVAIR